jgi:antitoxin VapB
MPLNIIDPETHSLAQELAQASGETMTIAVRQALRETLERLRGKRLPQATAEDLLAIGQLCAKALKGDKSIDHATLLYDEHGSPR